MLTEKEIREDFEFYRMLHAFHYPEEPLKRWVTASNYTNYYLEDWNALMSVIEKIENWAFSDDGDSEIFYQIRDYIPNQLSTYRQVVLAIKNINDSKSK